MRFAALSALASRRSSRHGRNGVLRNDKVLGTLAFMSVELPLTRDDVNALIVLLMRIDATVQELRDFLLEEDDDGEEEEEADG